MSGIGIITNPHSKLNKRNPRRKALLGYIVGEHGRLEITNSLEELAQVARRFRDRGIEILAINGGDGTISRTLSAIVQEYGEEPLPKIVVLGGGTINMLRQNLGLKGSPEQVLFRLTEAHASGDTLASTRLATLKVDGQVGFLFGNGVAASFLKEYYKRKSGPAGAAFWVFRVWVSRFLGSRLYSSVVRDSMQTIRADEGSCVSHRTCAVFCSTVERLPLGYALFAKVRENLKRFQVVSFCFPARQAVWQLPWTLLKKGEGTTRGKMSLTTSGLLLEAETPFDYTLDGELFTSPGDKLRIDMGPEIDFVVV